MNAEAKILHIGLAPALQDSFLVRYTNSAHFVHVNTEEKLSKELPGASLALVNLSETGLDSLALLAELRHQDPHLPVLVVAKKEYAQDALTAGQYNIQGILMPPFSDDQFEERVNQYLPVVLKREDIAVQENAAAQNTEESAEDLWNSEDSLQTIFFAGQSLMLKEDYDAAFKAFEFISQQKSLANDEELQLREKSLFEMARCFKAQKKAKSAVKQFQYFIKACPKSNFVNDAWFNLGEIYDQADQKDNAIFCFQKAMNIPNLLNKGITVRAKKMLKKLGAL